MNNFCNLGNILENWIYLRKDAVRLNLGLHNIVKSKGCTTEWQ